MTLSRVSFLKYIPGGNFINAYPRYNISLHVQGRCKPNRNLSMWSVPGGGGGGGGDKTDACSGQECFYILSQGVTYAILVICRGACINNGIAQCIYAALVLTLGTKVMSNDQPTYTRRRPIRCKYHRPADQLE